MPGSTNKLAGISREAYLFGKLSQKARSALRMCRLGLNLVSGGMLIDMLHRFPAISKIRQHQLTDYRSFMLWVNDLVHSMNTELHVHGEPMREGGLLVSNHISWLDTIILTRVKAVSFVARHDLADWPFLGKFTTRMGSVFINRDNKFQAYRSIPALESCLSKGGSVHIFPESTTSAGSTVLPFFPMFYEAAVRTERPVQPVLIRYADKQGRQLKEPAFIDDDAFFDTLKRIMQVDRVHAHLHFLPPIKEPLDRKQLAHRSHQTITAALKEHNQKSPE